MIRGVCDAIGIGTSASSHLGSQGLALSARRVRGETPAAPHLAAGDLHPNIRARPVSVSS